MRPAKRHLRSRNDTSCKRQRIATPKELAKRLAQVAQGLRETFEQALAGDGTSNPLMDLRDACAVELRPGVAQPANAEPFADMLAQTLVYGLFAARCVGKPGFTSTHPFLRRLFASVTGPKITRAPYTAFLADLERLLQNTEIDAILRALRQQGQGQDPLVHFYETFLAAYDPRLRRSCGVYFTPEPIVSFMVRAVDDLLKSRFGIPDGLAEREIPSGVLLVDPACGTGAFLSRVIAHVRDRFLKQTGPQTWSEFVHSALLPRLHGFELLLAPFALAHLQLGSQLTGNDLPPGRLRERCCHEFTPKQPLGIHLTTSLEEVARQTEQLLDTSGRKSAPAKGRSPILVVLGNPPYRGISSASCAWSTRLLEDYRFVNGAPLAEKKVWLKNDYVRFIRFGQWGIERAGRGILALVTDHSYLDSATFRGMRQNLLKTFDEIYVLNLHGNAKRREKAADGTNDENIFDIRQGVAITLFIKQGKKNASCNVFYEDMWGSRQGKYARLAASRMASMSWKRITPATPGFELVRINRACRAEYERGWLIKDVFPVGSNGVQTSRDHLVVAFHEKELLRHLRGFHAAEKTDAEVRQEFFGDKQVGNYLPGDTREWRLSDARASLRRNRSWRQAITAYSYRPFDERRLLYFDAMIDWPRRGVMGHLQQPNYALCIGRAGLVTSGTWDLAFCVNRICDHNLFYRGSSVNFPLYLYPDPKLLSSRFEQESRRCPNLSASFIKEVCETLRLRFVADQPGNLRATVGAENILHYAYALFHAPAYRQRYAEFLKYDFPRLPLTADVGLFRALVIRGEQLVRLHVGEIDAPTATHFPIRGDNYIEQIRYEEPSRAGGSGCLWINANQFFSDVPTKVWQFRIGGYQICRKWLSDRKGGRLSAQEQACYVRIVNVLSETIRLMHDIDGVIEQHGGWPIQGMRPVVTPPESTRRLAAKPHAAIKANAVHSPAQVVLDSCLSYT